jgi:hypothetical protein
MPSNTSWSRRDFLAFISSSSLAPLGLSCTNKKSKTGTGLDFKIEELKGAIREDKVTLSKGLEYDIVIKEGDPLGPNITFGTNNNFLNFYTFKDGKTALWPIMKVFIRYWFTIVN